MDNDDTAHSRPFRRLAVGFALGTALLVSACGSDETGTSGLKPTASLSVADALAVSDDQVHGVEGFVVSDGGQLWLCGALAESFPPQCGEPHLALAGIAAAEPETLLPGELTTSGQTQWTEDTVVLTGVVIGSELWIDQ